MQTPYYLLEEARLRRNLALISEVAQRSGAEIILAFKAFALWKTFPIFREYISHTTASSPDEALLASEEFGSWAHTFSPAYTEKDFPTILRCSSHITFNSLSQYRRFAPAARQWNQQAAAGAVAHPVSLGLRVNPEYSEIETELYDPCAPGSRFGVLPQDLPSPADFPADIEGFHIHCHCESSAESFARTLVHIIDKFAAWFPHLRWINFGGGHLMTRQGYNTDLLVATLQSFHERWPHLKMILEPGSAFAWQTGPLVASVVDVVENHGIKTAILDVSFTCHMPDCLEMPYHPVVRGAVLREEEPAAAEMHASSAQESADSSAEHPASAQEPAAFAYRLGGNSCLSGDFMGTWLFPQPLEVGQQIVFEDMIHYTTVKTTTFNGIHHPSIVLQHLDGTLQLLREYSYKDYRDRMD
ncbi:MAG: carboxynorspermidine decarboxylase [Bacteroidaceae bacterium]|nr:carboxynorspermidine decarboxylase [Bacteroidaceae bacterium]